MENIKVVEDFAFVIEFEKKFDITVWDGTDICGLFDITKEELNYLIERTGKKSTRVSWKKSFNVNFIDEGNSWTITTIGMFMLVYLNTDLNKYQHLKKYASHFSTLAMNDLIRYQGFKQKNKTKRKASNNNYDYEKQGEYNSKKINKDLKQTNLDIEDKSHIFYNKKILITGTFENFDDRNEMAEMIKKVGGHNKGISKSLDFVIIGKNAGPSKMEKIKEYGIRTLTEKDFIDLF